MRIRWIILSLLATIVFFTACTMTNDKSDLGQNQISSSKPVVVPYTNKTIDEVTKNAGHCGTDTNDTDRYFTPADEARRETGQDPDDPDEAAGNNDTDAEDGGRLGEPEGSAEWAAGVDIPGGGSGSFTDHTDSEASKKSMPELEEQDQYGGFEPEQSDNGDVAGCDEALTYLGNYQITFYCPCELCCGVWATGCTASGVLATEWHTVAAGEQFKFGTQLYIDGLGCFIVEDRGVEGDHIDVFVSDHNEALNLGLQYRDVYVMN